MYESCVVNSSIWVETDEGFVDTAILYWLHPSLGWQSVSMTNTTYDPSTGIGYYNASIPAFAYGIEIATYIWANDTAGAIGINNNSGSYHNYTVTDYWGPTIEDPAWTPPPITYNQTAYVEVAGIFSHWLAENRLKWPLKVPMVDEAVRGLQEALDEVLYEPENQ